MAVTQYIGGRYVPLFEDPAEWSAANAYEPLTIVLHEGNSFTSRQAVPEGIDIANEDYWVETGNYNAQVEQYRREVLGFDARITENAEDIATHTQEISTITADVTALQGDVTSLQGGLSDVQGDVTALQDDLSDVQGDVTSLQGGLSGVQGDVTALQGDLSDVQGDVTELQEAVEDLEVKRDTIACIGDSFGNASGEWADLLQQRTGKTIINKCTNGAGYTTGTKTFIQQMSEIVNDPNIARVSHIIVYGGVNDWSDAHATAEQMNAAFNQLVATYENISGEKPKLIIAFTNIGKPNRAIYNGFGVWYNECMRWLRVTAKQGIVVGAAYWLWGINGAYLSDNLHPTDRGSEVIASYMLQILDGVYSGCHFEIRTNTPITGEGYVDLIFNDGLFTVSCNLTNVTLNTGWTRLADFSDYGFGFGAIDEGAHNELQTVVVDYSATGEVKEFGFNVRNCCLWVAYRGTTTKPGTSGNAVSGNIACMVN